MTIEIKNPKKNLYGNDKNNIFLAYSKEGSYLGSAFVYANLTHSQIEAIPFLIFIAIELDEIRDKRVKEKAKDELLGKVLTRAYEIRKTRPDLNARIYSGFGYDQERMNFFVENGFEEDYSIVLRNEIKKDLCFELPTGIKISEIDVSKEKELTEYAELYDKIFISPLDKDVLLKQSKQKKFKTLYFFINGMKCGGCTIFEKNDLGYIETLYVLPEFRGRGLSKTILLFILNYFAENDLFETELEVWQLNKPAVALYTSFGYKEVHKNMMFPGKNSESIN